MSPRNVVDPIAYPSWTELQEKSGLDPLGMQTSSERLYQSLLPGISNVTLRIRYYGLYAWLSLRYAKEIGDTNPKTWQRYIRRAEALYALVAQERGEEQGIAGSIWARRTMSGSPGRVIPFADDAEPGSETHYLKQAWGAYGAAYASQLVVIGIYERLQTHRIPVPCPPFGTTLAEAFGAEIGALGDLFLRVVKRGTVRRAELKSMAKISASEIRPTGRERRCYEQILFGETKTDDASTLERRHTLLLILRLAEQLGRSPNAWDFRWSQYSGFAQEGLPLELSGKLSDHSKRWQVYHANDLGHICFGALLKCVLMHLEGVPAGITLSNLIQTTAENIHEFAPDHCHTWAAFVEQSPLAPNASDATNPESEAALSSLLIDAPLRDRAHGAEAGWVGLRLLAILHRRFQDRRLELQAEFDGLDPEWFRSLPTELAFLDAHANQPFERTIVQLLEKRVIRRHLWVALRKLRHQGDYTFLLEADNGLMRLRQMDGPVWTNPRLGSAITFLRDIKLIGDKGLTVQGSRLVALK